MTRSLGLTDCRSYPPGTAVSLAEGDYVERNKFTGIGMTSAQPQPDRSKEPRRRSTRFDNFPPGKHTQLMAVFPANLANPRVYAEDLSSPVGLADSGYLTNVGTRRDLPSFFTRNKTLPNWDVRILSTNQSVVKCITESLATPARTLFTPNTRSGSPPVLPHTFVVKIGLYDSASLRQEISVYDALRLLQGKEAPYCFGLYTFRDTKYLGIALEDVQGATLTRTFERVGGSEELFRKVWQALRGVHALNVAHGDIRGDNIVITPTWDVVFIDWENAV